MTLPPEAKDSEYPCGAFAEDGYRCTAAYSHDGDHIARDTDGEVCATWPRRMSA